MDEHLIICREVGSTQDLAREMALSGEPEGTAVMALTQTHGRGRMGRSWISPPGRNLALSVILRPTLAPSEAALLGLLTSIAVAETVESAGVPEAQLRWPNDVLVGGKKIAGILSEATVDEKHIEFVIVGVGLNVNSQEADFPKDLRTPATSVLRCTGVESDLEGMARSVLKNLNSLYRQVKKQGCGFITELWEQRWPHRGVRLIHERITGWGHGIDTNGALLLRTEDGRVERVTSGEVIPAHLIDAS